MPWAIMTPPRTGLFRNVWLMGPNAVLLTPEGSHRKAHSIAMGLDWSEPLVWFAYFLLFHSAFGFGD